MPYRVVRNPDGLPAVVLSGEPPYCRPLAAAPTAIEPELGAGHWLILTFAAWSQHDIAAIETALEAVKHFAGEWNLGLRPYTNEAEHDRWCPGLGTDEQSPIWLLLVDGKVREKIGGTLNVQELVAAIEATRILTRSPETRPSPG